MTDSKNLKEKLLGGFAPRPDIATTVNKSDRTVARWNLPTIYIGKTPYCDIEAARAKLMGEKVKPKRGRPPGTAHKAA